VNGSVCTGRAQTYKGGGRKKPVIEKGVVKTLERSDLICPYKHERVRQLCSADATGGSQINKFKIGKVRGTRGKNLGEFVAFRPSRR